MIKVLAIDGGGVRGIVPALFLKRLEADIGKPVCEIFDYVVGTSTGGILALALCKPSAGRGPAFPAEDLVKFYEEDGPKIFGVKRGIILAARRPRYHADGIDHVLSAKFGKTHLSDCLSNVVVTAYDMTNRTPKVFLSWKAKQMKGEDFLLRDVARATSAAPTYFSPVEISDRQNNAQYHLVDGGVFANNPAARGLVEALSHQTEANAHRPQQPFLLLSLGTGSLKRRYNHSDTADWGLVEWARPILDVVFDGVSDNVDHQLRVLHQAGIGLTEYFRFQGDLDSASDDMDNTSPTNFRQLRELATRIYTQNQKSYEKLTALLR